MVFAAAKEPFSKIATQRKENEKVLIRETKSPRGGSPRCWGYGDKAPVPCRVRSVSSRSRKGREGRTVAVVAVRIDLEAVGARAARGSIPATATQ